MPDTDMQADSVTAWRADLATFCGGEMTDAI
jgi:hypothetical protein